MRYSVLAEVYETLETTSKRLKKTWIMSNLLKETKEQDLERVILLLQGKVFHSYDVREIGVASKIVLKAISTSTGYSSKQIEDLWKKKGDLGLVSEHLMKSKKQNTLFKEDLTVKDVFETLQKLASLEGQGSVDHKVKLISRLLSVANPKESKFIIRTVLQDLRVGVAEGILRDAIAWAYLENANPNYDVSTDSINPVDRDVYNSAISVVQEALDKTNDFSVVAKEAIKGESALNKIKLVVGNPLKVMLAQKVKSVEEAFAVVGKPAALEFKYDGFRMQIHKNKKEVVIYTRRLEDVTKQFPEVKECVLSYVDADVCIIDCEAVGYDNKSGKYLPFQNVSQRIKRKYDIDRISKDLPVELNVFDIIMFNNNVLLNTKFSDRRKILENIVKQVPKKIVLSKLLISSDVKEGKNFFEESIKQGNEGLMFKNLEGIYKPGSRVGFMIKLKSAMDDIDVVVIGGEWGEGKRSGWLTSFTVACRSDDGFLELGKVGTGLKEKSEEGASFEDLTNLLKPLILEEKGRDVRIKPELVVTLQFEEIQKSPSYSSGFALRFPRFIAIRDDRSNEDIISKEEIEELFYNQRK